ncbi:MAG TPA: SDR family NAD(P)-dependent oxidoreductase [Jiangellaceae bacterium]
MRALVTGGAGHIGSAIATRLAASGYAVTVADLADPAPALASVIDRQLAVDVASEQGAREAVQSAAGTDGLDVLVNCVGVSPKKDGRKRPFAEITLYEWQRVFAINITACFLTMREAMPLLRRHANASIVNIVSAVAKLGTAGPDGASYGPAHPAGAHYCASKAALANLTVSGAHELAKDGIRCNGVAPGYIGSGMGGATDESVGRRLVGQLPLGRAGTADEVAAVVGFLVSPDASYLTGEIIDVDGGWVPD